MSDDSSPEAPVQSTEPIDAHFEPAPEEETKSGRRKSRGAGPGWLGAGVLSLIAALAGGAIGIGADRLKPARAEAGGIAPADLGALAARLDKLEQASLGSGDIRSEVDALDQRITSLAKAAPRLMEQAGLPDAARRGLSRGTDRPQSIDSAGIADLGDAGRLVRLRGLATAPA